jgi:hypothetical protein
VLRPAVIGVAGAVAVALVIAQPAHTGAASDRAARAASTPLTALGHAESAAVVTSAKPAPSLTLAFPARVRPGVGITLTGAVRHATPTAKLTHVVVMVDGHTAALKPTVRGQRYTQRLKGQRLGLHRIVVTATLTPGRRHLRVGPRTLVVSTSAPTITPLPTGPGSPTALGLKGVAWAGGPAFYDQFPVAARAGWTKPTYFPLGAWLESVQQRSDVAADKAAGMTTYVNLTDNSDPSVVRANGMTDLGDGTLPPGQGSETVGYVLSDEVDGWAGPGDGPYGGGYPGDGTICETDQKCGYTAMRYWNAQTPSGDGRLRYMGYTTAVLAFNSDAEASEFVNDFQDVVAADLYWYTVDNCEAYANAMDLPGGSRGGTCRTAQKYGANVDRLRFLQTVPSHEATPGDIVSRGLRPVWMDVELGCPFTDTPALCITPDQTAGAVWSSLIHGAMGIIYFNHNFNGPCPTQNVVRDTGCSLDVAATKGVTALNARIKNLAPVLNTQSLAFTANPNADTMLKYYNGSYYLFSMLSDNVPAGTIGLKLPAGLSASTVQVVDENRTLPVTNGQISDSFTHDYSVHIYKITPGA